MIVKRFAIFVFILLIAFGPEVTTTFAQKKNSSHHSVKKKSVWFSKKKSKKKPMNSIKKSKRGKSNKFYFPF